MATLGLILNSGHGMRGLMIGFQMNLLCIMIVKMMSGMRKSTLLNLLKALLTFSPSTLKCMEVASNLTPVAILESLHACVIDDRIFFFFHLIPKVLEMWILN